MSIYDDRPPLWTVMCAAYAATPPTYHAAFYYAAEIRALADWLAPEMDEEMAPFAIRLTTLRALLFAEADRAEAGG
jgi:hypothetical protein